jgi:hypothetical protein
MANRFYCVILCLAIKANICTHTLNSSLYNYVELGAFIFPIIGCFKFLNTEPGMTPMTGRFSQDWILGFGILLIHLNMVGSHL